MTAERKTASKGGLALEMWANISMFFRPPRRIDQRDQHKTDDHQQKPRPIFPRPHELPTMRLLGINPGLGEGSDVFRSPDEQRDQRKPQQQRHPPKLSKWPKIGPSRAKGCGHADEQRD